MRVRVPAILSCVYLFLLSTTFAVAQNAPTAAPQAAAEDPAAVLAKNFGDDLKLAEKFPVLKGDLDGDGNEDIVFVVTGKNPLAQEAAYGYRVADPYNDYWGFGDPKVTMGFVSMDPGKAKYLAVIHGWKLPVPKAKFILVNVPFESVSMGSVKLKKKAVNAVIAQESGGVTAAVFFNGKKYKWEAIGAEME